jgi:mono/diheme cytochrome c family protein
MDPSKALPPRALLVAVFTSFGFIAACSSNSSVGATGTTCPSDSTLTYASFGQAFFANNCLSCHSGREQPALTSQAAIQANADEIDMVAAAGPNGVNTKMPEDGSVSTSDRTKLGQWLACGAP